MNIILLEQRVNLLKLGSREKNARHITTVLKAKKGDTIDVGLKNGPKGKATLVEINSQQISLSINWFDDHQSDLYPIVLLIGLSRPQTCRRILEQASTMGVAEMHFCPCEKAEISYCESRLWTTEEWKEKIIKGVEQSFSTFIPKCKVWNDFESCLSELGTGGTKIALDNYESSEILSSTSAPKGETQYLAVGPERGWSTKERNKLKYHGFSLYSLGPRVLRQDTAVVVGLGQLLSGYWEVYKS